MFKNIRFNTLYGKISIALSGLFLLTLILLYFIVSSNYHDYQQEATQHVNRNLAKNIIIDKSLDKGEKIKKKIWKKYLQSAMIANPYIDLYFVDLKGKILNFALHKELVVRKNIGVSPILKFLNEDSLLPIYGDDPRSKTGKKMFSAAPVKHDGKTVGYLYIVLKENESLAKQNNFHRSFIVKSTFTTLIMVALFMLASTLVLFKFIVRRIEKLALTMNRFKNSAFKIAPNPNNPITTSPDEVDELNAIFNQLANLTVKQMESLKEKDTSRRELVSQICHDVRTPLTSLNGYIETLLLNNASMSSSERSRFLNISADQGRRIDNLINDLFLVSKLDDFDYKISPEAFFMSELVQDVCQKLSYLISQKKINLKIIKLEHSESTIVADISMIERLLDNLLDNAIKYTPHNGTITVRIRYSDKHCFLSLKDSGIGLKQHECDLIFNKFYRTNSALQSGNTGSGLGLAICKRIVELHDGKIRAVSTPDSGTEIQVFLKTSTLLSLSKGNLKTKASNKSHQTA